VKPVKPLAVVIVAAVVIAMGIAAAFGWSPAIMAIMTAEFRKNQEPATRAFPEGLNVVLIGTGSPMGDISREGACIAVVAGGHTFIVDAGEGSNRNIQLAKIPSKLDALLLTHFHSDHIASLGDIALGNWNRNKSTEPLLVIGPPGVDRVVSGFNEAYALDDGYRVQHHGAEWMPPRGAGSVARTVELGPESDASTVIFEADGLKVTMFRVDHGVVKPAVGYRFDYRGRSVAVSGDTMYTESIIRNAAGVNILFCEALSVPFVSVIERYANNPSTAKVAHDIPDYHSSPEDAAKIASGADAGMLALYHIIPPTASSIMFPSFLGDSGKYYHRQITIGADGMMFNLKPDSKNVRQSRRF
jgi:ribonuclease Z